VGSGVGGNGGLVRGSASVLGSLRKGTKFTVPRLKSFLLSRMDWFIACGSVVPHQLQVALMRSELSK